MRELISEELDRVGGGWEVPGNPGNLMAVGNAGETPSGNANFITGGTVDPNNPLNGAYGNSSN
jgi:hypothetical protein